MPSKLKRRKNTNLRSQQAIRTAIARKSHLSRDRATIESFKPLPKQKLFIESQADITIFGGGAGGGKTQGLLLDLSQDQLLSNPGYRGVIFRRTHAQAKHSGSIVDASGRIYPALGGQSAGFLWRFPSGANIEFGHLKDEKTRFDWQGAEIARLGFDELTHFTWVQFIYLLGRARTTCGIKPQTKATCNPDPQSWVATFIAWWIDSKTGYPIPDRSGVLRWFVQSGDTPEDLVWADNPEILKKQFPKITPQSLTFIPSLLKDNPKLQETNPNYESNLQVQSYSVKMALLYGNWKVSNIKGIVERSWINRHDQPVAKLPTAYRVGSLDTANKKGLKNADWSLVIFDIFETNYYLKAVETHKFTYPEGKDFYKTILLQYDIETILIEDKSSGIDLIQEWTIDPDINCDIIPIRPTNDKYTRFNIASKAYQKGKIYHPNLDDLNYLDVNSYENIITSYPNTHSIDPVDATSQFIIWANDFTTEVTARVSRKQREIYNVIPRTNRRINYYR